MLFFSSIVMDFFESVETDPTGEKAWLSWGRIKNSFLISSVRSPLNWMEMQDCPRHIFSNGDND